MIITNLEDSRKTLQNMEQLRNEMIIILNTSKDVVDRQTYEVFQRVFDVVVDARIEMRSLIFDVESCVTDHQQ